MLFFVDRRSCWAAIEEFSLRRRQLTLSHLAVAQRLFVMVCLDLFWPKQRRQPEPTAVTIVANDLIHL